MASCLKSCLYNFFFQEEGTTAVEYAAMLSFIIVVCMSAVSALGSNVSARFSEVATSLVSSS